MSGSQDHFPTVERTLDIKKKILYVCQLEKTWGQLLFSEGTRVHLPAEKGMNAFLDTNFPCSFRKCPGLNVCGLSHSLSSARTDVSKGKTVVPCKHTGFTSAQPHSRELDRE